MGKKFSRPRGTNDILPSEAGTWLFVEETARNIFKAYNYKEIRTPCFEETELFARSMGQASEVVNKQMLTLSSQKKDGKSDAGTALRPENTASVVRSYIENSLDRKENITKLYYIGPMFRGERPQKGRLRQFHQIGAEVIGPETQSPYLDAEVISLNVELLKGFGVKDFTVELNTLGTDKDKENLAGQLKKKLKPFKSKLSEESQDRLQRNVFRVLDSKNKKDREIVAKIDIGHDYLSKESKEYFDDLQSVLKDLKVPFQVNPTLVRGLDYYTHTVFEITSEKLGSQDALSAGGRYGGLVKQLGGADVDAMGFALGVERVLLATDGSSGDAEGGIEVFIVAMSEEALPVAFRLLSALRNEGIPSDMNFRSGSMKSLMRQANKHKAEQTVILGEEEIKKNVVTLKDMDSGEQAEVESGPDFGSIIEKVKEKKSLC